MAFLSLLDDRARAKGSRDPLGFEMVWTWFGRRVVGNLTTITTSWRIFSVGLLGFHWSNKLCRDIHPAEKQEAVQNHFIRYEQLAAFLRALGGDEDIMGITRVRKRLADDNKDLFIGTGQEDLILSDQISYGIWGLYSTAMRETGLVEGDSRELTPLGQEVVSWIESGLDETWYEEIVTGRKPGVARSDLEAQSSNYINAIADDRVRKRLIEVLLRGQGNHECQQALYDASRRIDKKVLETGDLPSFISAIQEKTTSEALRRELADIMDIERLLVTANTLFDYCRREDGKPLENIADKINNTYDFGFIPPGPHLEACPYAEDLRSLRQHLKGGQTSQALRTLLALNKKIMEGRGGAPWVEENSDGTLRVRVNSETGSLVPQGKLELSWHYNYFLDSFARIARTERD